MNRSDYIIEVTEADFESEVLAYSFKYPVVVDFWAEWCGPCRMLGPILERLAEESKGEFRLAKLNVDDNPNLAVRYGVRSIPYVKAFKDGKVVAEFVGAQPEGRVREFIRGLAPSKDDLLLEKGQSLMEAREWRNAEGVYRQILTESPQNAAALLGLAKSLLLQNNPGEAESILANFPASREYAAAQALLPLTRALLEPRNGNLETDNPLEAAYNQALRLVKRGNLPAALDGLLDILRQDKHYRDGQVRVLILALLELLGEQNPLTRQYRQELASALF